MFSLGVGGFRWRPYHEVTLKEAHERNCGSIIWFDRFYGTMPRLPDRRRTARFLSDQTKSREKRGALIARTERS